MHYLQNALPTDFVFQAKSSTFDSISLKGNIILKGKYIYSWKVSTWLNANMVLIVHIFKVYVLF